MVFYIHRQHMVHEYCTKYDKNQSIILWAITTYTENTWNSCHIYSNVAQSQRYFTSMSNTRYLIIVLNMNHNILLWDIKTKIILYCLPITKRFGQKLWVSSRSYILDRVQNENSLQRNRTIVLGRFHNPLIMHKLCVFVWRNLNHVFSFSTQCKHITHVHHCTLASMLTTCHSHHLQLYNIYATNAIYPNFPIMYHNNPYTSALNQLWQVIRVIHSTT